MCNDSDCNINIMGQWKDYLPALQKKCEGSLVRKDDIISLKASKNGKMCSIHRCDGRICQLTVSAGSSAYSCAR